MTNFNAYKLTRTEDRELRDEIKRIVLEHAPITVRGVYYQCVLSEKLPFLSKDSGGSKRNYVLVQARLKHLRKVGVIPSDAVVDPGYSARARNRWSSPEQFAQDAPLIYKHDVWAGYKVRPLVLLQKEGQIPVYEQHAATYGVDVWACKGYSSVSNLQALAEHIKSLKQHVDVLVCADWDPSGCDWPRAAEKGLKDLLSGSDYQIRFRRILVTEDEAARSRDTLGVKVAKSNDPRTAKWLDHYCYKSDGENVVEMDALAPNEARKRLQSIYVSMRRVEDPSWELSKDSELLAQQRAKIKEVLAALQKEQFSSTLCAGEK